MASKPCLPVSRRRKNHNGKPVDFSDVASMDASEFLSRVVQQSSQLPDVLHHQQQPKKKYKNKHADHVPIEGSAASLSYLISDRTAVIPPPSPRHLPANCSEWLDQTLTNFSQLRSYLETIQSQQNNGRKERKLPVPPMKDRPGWHIFCVGQKEARGNLGGYFAEDEDSEEEKEEELEDRNDEQMEESEDLQDEEKVQSTHNAKENENRTVEPNKQSTENDCQKGIPEDGMFPTVSLVLQLDQVMVRRVISHLSYYVQEGWYPCSPQRTRWLYSLLARMEKPIHRNDAAVLYSLLKALTRARATLPELIETDREGLAKLNTLIAIVGVYFEQGGGLCF